MASCFLSYFCSLAFLLYRRKKSEGGGQSARKVYNALKPARNRRLYIKPVNLLVTMSMVPSTQSPPPTAQSRKRERRVFSHFTSPGLNYCHLFCVTIPLFAFCIPLITLSSHDCYLLICMNLHTSAVYILFFIYIFSWKSTGA